MPEPDAHDAFLPSGKEPSCALVRPQLLPELPEVVQVLPVDGAQGPAVAWLAGVSRHSVPTMRRALDALARLLGAPSYLAVPWHRLTRPYVLAIRARLEATCAPATARVRLAALRGVLREAWRAGLLTRDQLARLTDLPPIAGSRLPRGRALEPGEVSLLFAGCAADHSPAGARDAALLALLYGCGLRRSEAVALDLEHVNPDGSVRVLGKGNRERTVWLPAGARRALQAWLEQRGDAPGPLLWRVAKGGRLTPRRISDHAAWQAVRKRARKAGLGELSPHDLRRTWVGAALDAGADLASVQALAGHASPATTARYDRRPERARKRAAELVPVPWSEE